MQQVRNWSFEVNRQAKEIKLFDFKDNVFFIRQTTRVLEPLPKYVSRELKKLGLIPAYLQELWNRGVSS